MSFHTAFRWVYAILVLNFWIPVLVYVFAPDVAVSQFGAIGTMLGHGAYPHTEDSAFWRVLGIANVATLGFCCALLWSDVQRWFPVLVPLVWLKAWASAGFAVQYAFEPFGSYAAASAFDALTVAAMIGFAVPAKRERDSGVPGWHNLIVRKPDVVLQTLAKLEARGQIARAPNLWQVALGILYMRYRITFRSDTIGLGSAPVRGTWRARLLSFRMIRGPFLLWERAIAPFELTGLSLPVDFLERHLLGAYHQIDHGMYDMELLVLHDGALERLRPRVAEAAAGVTPRAKWLQDLCIYEGYHQKLLELIDRAIAGDHAPEDTAIPSDTTLAGFLGWCAAQPETPAETWSAWWGGRFSLDPRWQPAAARS